MAVKRGERGDKSAQTLRVFAPLGAAVEVVSSQVAHHVGEGDLSDCTTVSALAADKLKNHLGGHIALLRSVCGDKVCGVHHGAIVARTLEHRPDCIAGKHDPER